MVKSKSKMIKNKICFFTINRLLRPLILVALIVTVYWVILEQVNDIKTVVKYEEQNTVMVTIDSLITSSTIAFVAFINYAPSSSGSSQVLKKAAWDNTYYSKDDKWYKKIFIFCFSPILLRVQWLLVITIVISMLDIPFYIFGSNELIKAALMINVFFSAIFLLAIIIKYSIYNHDIYSNGAVVVSKRLDHYLVTDNKKLKRRIIRTIINPLINSKNDTFIREILRFINKNNKIDGFNFLKKYLENKIIFASGRELSSSLSLYITLEHSNEKIEDERWLSIMNVVSWKHWNFAKRKSLNEISNIRKQKKDYDDSEAKWLYMKLSSVFHQHNDSVNEYKK